jgi:peptidoglycan/LPS O-acetylase OafA/YrhL
MSESPVVYLKGLNGIRALAALSVVASHVASSFGQFGLRRMYGLDLASYGVTMFFTLSGFLITYLLLIEKKKFGTINIKQFYIRRILRIWPLYYLYLIIAIIVLLIYEKEVLTGQTAFYVFLLANVPFIIARQIPVIGHYWSLGVEEQFYAFWPWVVKKVNRIFVWLVWFVIIMGLLKLAFWFYYHSTGNPIPVAAVHITRFHCMAIGAAGAVLFFGKNRFFLKAAYSYVTQVIIWAIVVLVALNKFNVKPIINDELISGVSILLIVNVAGNPKSLIKLDNKYLDYLGKISFGIYVYHPLIIFLEEKWMASYIRGLDPFVQMGIIGLVAVTVTIIIAGLSYKYFESRFLQYKKKFTRVESSGSAKEAYAMAQQHKPA